MRVLAGVLFNLALLATAACDSAADLGMRENGPCSIGGVELPHGIVDVPSGDGCNRCNCFHGIFMCTLLACPEPAGCSMNGRTYADGWTRVPDPKSCNCCACEGGKRSRCSTEACALPPACKFGELVYQHGFGFGKGDQRCTCDAGKFRCGPTAPALRRESTLNLTLCPLPKGWVGPEPRSVRPGKEPVRASRAALDELGQRWTELDLEMIRNVREALPPAIDTSAWLTSIRGAAVEEPADLGFGLERLAAHVTGGHGTCRLAHVEFNARLLELRVECSFDRWKELRDVLAPALGPAFQLEERGDGAVARLVYESPDRKAEARRALDSALGALSDVPVPRELAPAYELLMSPLSRLTIGRDCGARGTPIPGRQELLRLTRAKGFDLLRNVLRGPNPEARLYAAWALRQQRAVEPPDAATLRTVADLNVEVATCSGLQRSRQPSSQAELLLRVAR